MRLDQIQTLAFGGLVIFLGYGVRKLIPPLARYNIPAPVVGGLIVAGTLAATRSGGTPFLTFDYALEKPLMVAFFTTIGFSASLTFLKIGGPQVLLFLAASSVVAVLQNVLGVGVASFMGVDPLLGVLAGSVTLTGGPATGLAFAEKFEQAGIEGAAVLAVAAGMSGIVAGGLVGGPISTLLIERKRLAPTAADRGEVPIPGLPALERAVAGRPPAEAPEGEDDEAFGLLKNIVVLLAVMWVGSVLSAWIERQEITMPPYIGAMIVAAIVRNVDDGTRVIRISPRTLSILGDLALAFFLAIALMRQPLWEIAGLAIPLAVILVAQVLLVVGLALWPMYRLMGRNYSAAVMSGGFCGFMLGTTANAMANMKSIVERYGPAPRAFLVVPIVGAFLIDFINSLLVTACLELFS